MSEEFNVIAKIRIMPEGLEVDLTKIEEKLRKEIGTDARLNSIETKPVAFGLNSLVATILLNDSKGGLEELQERIQGFEGVSQVEVTDIGRL
ncbi:MAG: elongation factor 1-beta [Candidatus Altiarchaeota archaeon]